MTTPNKKQREPPELPFAVAKQIGWRRLILHKFALYAAIGAVLLSVAVPWLDASLAWNIVRLQVGVLGFSFASFTLLVLGGGDDFLKASLQRKLRQQEPVDTAKDALKRLIFALWFPLPLHSICILLAVSRILLQDPIDGTWSWVAGALSYVFRGVYAFFLIWALLETYDAINRLFAMFNLRVNWQYDRVLDEEGDDS